MYVRGRNGGRGNVVWAKGYVGEEGFGNGMQV